MLQPNLADRLREILETYLQDNVKARLLQSDGDYIRAPRVGAAFAAQDVFMALASDDAVTSTPTAPLIA